jgi:coenzyme F420-reducing hydrogenase gamma subunit
VGQFPTATANKCSSATKVVGVDVLMISGCPNPKDPIVQVIIYTAWNIWKERCRRNLDNRSFERADLCCVIRQDIVLAGLNPDTLYSSDTIKFWTEFRDQKLPLHQ